MKKEDYSNKYIVEYYSKVLSMDEYYENYVDYSFTKTKCSKCQSYNTNWACPEFMHDEEKLWHNYDNIQLFLTKIIFNKEVVKTDIEDVDINLLLHQTLFHEKNKLLKKMYNLEKHKNGLFLTSGYCNICDKCARMEDKNCIHPELKRFSMEAVGAMVIKTTEEEFNIKIQWFKDGKIPEYLTILHAILY